jgi:hypothetical protein
MKGIAKDYNIPVISLSQLTKESLKGTDKRPTIDGLYGGKAIEENADDVFGLYRGEKYDDFEVPSDRAEIISLKRRNADSCGRNRKVLLGYNGSLATFFDLGAPKPAQKSEPKQAIAQESDEYYYNGLKVGDSVVVNETYSLFRSETTIADMIANKEIPPFGVICTVTRLWTEEYLGSKMGGAALKTPDGIELHSSPDYLRLA